MSGVRTWVLPLLSVPLSDGSTLRAGRIFDTPPLGRALQSAFNAVGLLLDLEGFETIRGALRRCRFT